MVYAIIRATLYENGHFTVTNEDVSVSTYAPSILGTTLISDIIQNHKPFFQKKLSK